MDDDATATQQAHVQESRLVLRKRILNFRVTQALFTPEAILPTQQTDDDNPESDALRLPSELISSHMLSPRSQALANMEARLRFAQATDALSGLRRSLAIRAQLSKYKNTQVKGQHANTRTRALLSTAQEKTAAHAARYRRARMAYSQLMGPGDWEDTLKPLMDGDIRTLATHQDEAVLTARTGPREGHRIVSWIYMIPGSTEESTQLDDGEQCGKLYSLLIIHLYSALCVEWLKARARRDRWKEEVELLSTELTRAAIFFNSKAGWWTSLAEKRSGVSPELADGLRAYAARQADIQCQHANRVRSLHHAACGVPSPSC